MYIIFKKDQGFLPHQRAAVANHQYRNKVEKEPSGTARYQTILGEIRNKYDSQNTTMKKTRNYLIIL